MDIHLPQKAIFGQPKSENRPCRIKFLNWRPAVSAGSIQGFLLYRADRLNPVSIQFDSIFHCHRSAGCWSDLRIGPYFARTNGYELFVEFSCITSSLGYATLAIPGI